MKRKIFISFLASAIALCMMAPSFAATGTTSAASSKHAVITKATITANVEGLTTKISYPQVSGLKSRSAQNKINASFYNMASKALEEGKINAASLKSEGYTGEPCETDFGYKVKYNTKGILSVVFTDYQYSGGAHGYTIMTSKNIKLSNGKSIALRSMFTNKKAAVKKINSKIKSKIKSRKLTQLFKFRSIAKKQSYYITKKGITVFFQEYEYFPYADGIQHFTITHKVLKPYMKAKYNKSF